MARSGGNYNVAHTMRWKRPASASAHPKHLDSASTSHKRRASASASTSALANHDTDNLGLNPTLRICRMINSYGYSVRKLLYRAEDFGMQNLKKRKGTPFIPSLDRAPIRFVHGLFLLTIDLDTIGIGVVCVHVLDDFDIDTSPNFVNGGPLLC